MNNALIRKKNLKFAQISHIEQIFEFIIVKAETFLQLPRDEFIRSLELIKFNANLTSDKSAIAIKTKLQMMNYIGYMCLTSSQLADEFINIELYKELLIVIKSGHNLEM
jgi:hypothetical protein